MSSHQIALNPIHLKEVRVALDGSLISSGSMDYPADRVGHFPCPKADFLRISRVEGFRIVRCRVSRDLSGFLTVDEYGSELHMPAPLAAIVERAFCFGADEPRQASLGHQDGALASSTSRIETLTQPLSDWTLRVDDKDGTISVDLSARLHGTIISDWATNTANYWHAADEPRINARFCVDPVTRVACFGAYIPSLTRGPETPATIPESSGLAGLDVANAPVGALAQFAVSGNRWYSLYEGVRQQKSLVLTEHGPPTRTSQGLLNDSHNCRWPRIYIHGLDMETISAMLHLSDRIRLATTGHMLGEAYQSYGSGGSKSTSIDNLVLEIKIDAAGLHIRITGNAESVNVSVSVLIQWELLILRFPYFTRFMSRSSSIDSRFRAGS